MRKLEIIAGALLALLLSVGAVFADVGTVTPAGTTQATAATMTAQDVYITAGSTPNAGVILKSKAATETQSVTNGSTVQLKIYPPVGGKINNMAVNAPIILNPNTSVTVQAYDSLQYMARYNTEITTNTVGTVTSSTTETATEYGDDTNHVTSIAMTNFVIGTSADLASLGIGAKFYTYPAGTIIVENTSMKGGITCAISVTTNTPEVGIGSVVASGAVAVLSGTATFEDQMDGNVSGTGGDTVAPDVAGTTFYKSSSFTAPIVIKTTGGKARDTFLNIAAAWADVTAPGSCTFTGTITLKWRIVG